MHHEVTYGATFLNTWLRPSSLLYNSSAPIAMEKEDLKRQVETLRMHKDLQRMFISDAVKE